MAPRERSAATSTNRNSRPRPAPAARRAKGARAPTPENEPPAPGGDEARPAKGRAAKARPAEGRAAKGRPAQARSAKGRPAQDGSTKARSGKARPAEARSGKAHPGSARVPAAARGGGRGARAPELEGVAAAVASPSAKRRRRALVRAPGPEGIRPEAQPLAGPTPSAPPHVPAGARPVTLTIDIGGTGIKGLLLDQRGGPLGERVRILTPKPAVPARVLPVIEEICQKLPGFDRVSVGFPGVVQDNTIKTAPNLHATKWAGFALGEAIEGLTGKPARVINDAGVQGYGVVEGRGVEMVITFGTGMGCALFLDGRYVPNLELGHHPLRDGKTYEDLVGDAELKRLGERRWLTHVREVVEQILPIWNPRLLYLGGGNARLIRGKLPPNVRVVENVAGLLGGIALWHD
ncbi:MAG TPA: ROK family protein [Polyangiaceae bacterium]|nr:ROK family protein [Polyangiaceae bacterium]